MANKTYSVKKRKKTYSIKFVIKIAVVVAIVSCFLLIEIIDNKPQTSIVIVEDGGEKITNNKSVVHSKLSGMVDVNAKISYDINKRVLSVNIGDADDYDEELESLDIVTTKPTRGIHERELYGMWMTKDEETVITYMFQSSKEYGAYTIFRIEEQGDKEVQEPELTYTGTYSLDSENTLTLSFTRKYNNIEESLEDIEHDEVFSVTEEEDFFSIKKGDLTIYKAILKE